MGISNQGIKPGEHMDRARARGVRHAPVHLRRPDREMIAGLCAVSVTVGLLLCGLQDAVQSGRTGWQGFFLALIVHGFCWYIQLALDWARWQRE